MPELPEVEVVSRGVSEAFAGRRLTRVVRRCECLRWPVPAGLEAQILAGPVLRQVLRRGKYLLLGFDAGTLLLHLGMSGSLLHLPAGAPPQKHDHLDLVFGDRLLRLHDPRRFGAALWCGDDVARHRPYASICSLMPFFAMPAVYTSWRPLRGPLPHQPATG